jgi:hypothetical protein
VDTTFRDDLDSQFDQHFARFEANLAQGLAELKADLLKWMFGFWATTTLALVALALRK